MTNMIKIIFILTFCVNLLLSNNYEIYLNGGFINHNNFKPDRYYGEISEFGTIKSINVESGDNVETKDLLVEIN